MTKLSIFTLVLLSWSVAGISQNFLHGSYKRTEVSFEGSQLVISDFRRKKNKHGMVKAKYFAKDANDQFRDWQDNKQILFYCSGAFSESWDTDSPPLGICVDNGRIVNRNIDNRMDGLIIVYNGGAQAGGIAVVNIEKDKVNVNQGQRASYNLRNASERSGFLRWASSQDATVFQTQLMYTKAHSFGFSDHNLTYGEKAERRFLAICMKNGVVHHVVIDHPNSDYLNRAAKRVCEYLSEELDYEIYGLFNLDTGGKNIMKAFDEDGNQLANGPEDVSIATNLLVYYVE
ncbi:MAG: hypothetical protein AAF399_10490 [Bacteroidota bacterium]